MKTRWIIGSIVATTIVVAMVVLRRAQLEADAPIRPWSVNAASGSVAQKVMPEPSAPAKARPAPQFSAKTVASAAVVPAVEPASNFITAPEPQPVVSSPAGSTQASRVDQENLRETQQMYLAHVSLRAPEVADPNSTTNRKVLQQMVMKALAHAQAGSTVAPSGQDIRK